MGRPRAIVVRAWNVRSATEVTAIVALPSLDFAILTEYRSSLVQLPPNARFSTVCVHAGQEPDPTTGAIITPIYQTSTYVQDELGKHKGYEYGRTQNPTRMALERNIAAIEAGKIGRASCRERVWMSGVAVKRKTKERNERDK